jgi:hypothetical protein
MSLLGIKKHQRPAIVAVGLFGAALIYGDGAITPAISVLSALEGLNIAAPAHYVFSGDGEHGNPERETLEMLLEARGDVDYTIFPNCLGRTFGSRGGQKPMKGGRGAITQEACLRSSL